MSVPFKTLQLLLAIGVATSIFAPRVAGAQADHEVIEADEFGPEVVSPDYQPLSSAEVDDLIGPIALYPDDLVSIVLPAATYPVQVVQAARYLQQREGNPNLAPPDDWDDAVVALLNYPEVIELMNDDLDWTWALGEAFLNQQSEVLAAIREFRVAAYAAGNLRTDEHQVVRRSDEVIEIEPADPEVIYVPYYEPERVIVYQPYPVYHYHSYPRYSYYYPYPADYGFSYGYFFGVSTAFRLHWANHSLYTYHYGYRGHPYFGRGYHNRFYYRHYPSRHLRPRQARSRGGYAGSQSRGDRWRPRGRHGSRPHAARRSHDGRSAGLRPRSDRRGSVDRPTRRGDQRSVTPRNRGDRRAGDTQTSRGHDAQRPATDRNSRRDRNRPRHVYSDKDPEQKRLVRRYREGAANARSKRSDRTGSTRNTATNPRAQSRQASPRARVASDKPRNHAARPSRHQATTASEPRRIRQANSRPATPRSHSASRSKPKISHRASTNQRSRSDNRRAQTRRQASPSRPRAAPQRQVQRTAKPAQTRANRPPPRQAAPARKSAPRQARRDDDRASAGRSKARNGKRRAEPRRR